MLITCPHCQTVFQLADEMLPPDPSTVQLKCSRCQAVFSLPVSFPSEMEPEDQETVDGDESVMAEPDSAQGIIKTPDFENEAAEAETPGQGSSQAVFDVSEELPQAADDGLGPDPGAETLDEVLAEVDHGENDYPEEKNDGKVADDLVFELADDYDAEVDDLSWDIDDDQEMTPADEAQAVKEGSGETALDDEGLPAVDDEQPVSGVAEAEKLTAAPGAGDGTVKTEEVLPAAAKPAKTPAEKRRTFLYLVLIFVVLSLAVWGGMLLWQKFSIDMEKHLSIVGLESHNYIFPSGKRVIAIRGKIYNTSPKIVGKLKIKGVIVDRQGKVLDEKMTAGGVTFSAEELQNLDGKMLEKLENHAAIVPAHGGELPFMLVFYGYPPSASSYHVELTDFSVLKKGHKP